MVGPQIFKNILNDTNIKKKKKEKCEDYRTISLITHASKIIIMIIHNLIETQINNNQKENQFGIRGNKRTREAILCLRMIMKKMYSGNKPMYLAFVNLEIDVDNVTRKSYLNV